MGLGAGMPALAVGSRDEKGLPTGIVPLLGEVLLQHGVSCGMLRLVGKTEEKRCKESKTMVHIGRMW